MEKPRTFIGENNGALQNVVEFIGPEDLILALGGLFGEVEHDGVLASGVGDFGQGGFGAGVVGLPVKADFVFSGILDAELEEGRSVTGGIVVAVSDVRLEARGV